MSLKIIMICFAGLLLSAGGYSPARADVVQFDFTGTVTNRFNNGLPNPSDIFGLIVNVGDAVSGSFTIDTSAPQFGSASGSVGGAAVGYTQTLPSDIRVNLAGGVFTSDGAFASSIANDFQDNTMFPPFEQFSVSDGVSSGSQNITGDTILLDGNQETARLAVTFTDNDATAFDSTALPISLNLSLFEIAEGTISGTRPSGQANPFFYQAAFRVDTISVTAVPEPSTMAFFACGVLATGGAVLRKRHRARS